MLTVKFLHCIAVISMQHRQIIEVMDSITVLVYKKIEFSNQ